MKQNEAKLKEWKLLYKAFEEFKILECWQWIYDSELFGFENPDDKMIGYCCVLGKLGRFKGLAVYEGIEGLDSYLKICDDQNHDVFNFIPKQKCLMASIEKPSQLEENDFKIIEQLGLQFANDHYPLFRNHLPNYLPWYLTSYDVKFLTLALEQTVDIATRAKNNKKLITKNEIEYLVRVFEKEQWQDKYITPDNISNRTDSKKLNIPIIENNLLDEVKKIKIDNQKIWELSYISIPEPIQENDERPYYPYIIAIIVEDSVTPIGIEICDFKKTNIRLPALFMNTCLENEYVPSKIIVNHEDIFELLQMIAKELKIKVSIHKKLKTLDPIIKNLASIALAEQQII